MLMATFATQRDPRGCDEDHMIPNVYKTLNYLPFFREKFVDPCYGALRLELERWPCSYRIRLPTRSCSGGDE